VRATLIYELNKAVREREELCRSNREGCPSALPTRARSRAALLRASLPRI